MTTPVVFKKNTFKKNTVKSVCLALCLTAFAPANAKEAIDSCHEYDLTLPAGLAFVSTSACQVSSGLIAVKDQKGKHGYINTKSEVVIAPQFDNAWDFAEGYAVVRKGKLHGYIKPDGQYAIRPIYDDAWDFGGGLATIKQGEKYGFIDKAGKLVGAVEYDDVYSYFSDGFALVQKGEKWGMIDPKGKTIAPLKYQTLEEVANGRILARLGEHYGYLDYQGKVALPFEYEEATGFENGIARVLKKGADEFTTINKNGKVVTPKPDYNPNY